MGKGIVFSDLNRYNWGKKREVSRLKGCSCVNSLVVSMLVWLITVHLIICSLSYFFIKLHLQLFSSDRISASCMCVCV